MEGVSERLNTLLAHLVAGNETVVQEAARGRQDATEDRLGAFEGHAFRLFIEKHDTEYRDWIIDQFDRSGIFHFDTYHLSMKEQRKIAWKRIKFIQKIGIQPVSKPQPTIADSFKTWASAETFLMYDHSMSTMAGVQFTLWCGSLVNLGTERHRDLFERSLRLEIPGCFAVTELGHGSNIKGIETTAIYDVGTQEFVINTPTETAQKYWIGNAMRATMGTVFAQLYVGGKHYGVHAFVVPLRDESGKPLPGVRIADCGHKMGVNGIDNGRFWFDNIRIPRENLLNKIGDVTPEGEYQSWIKDNDLRFTAYIAELVAGRVTINCNSIQGSKIALATAILYALQRRQFSLAGSTEETLLMDYLSHQRRLLPFLARTIAATSSGYKLKEMWLNRSSDPRQRFKEMKDIHIIASGLKAANTTHLVSCLQFAREACGGLGFKSDARIGIIKNDVDALLTLEGDNFVLFQQVSKTLLKEFKVGLTSGKWSRRLHSIPAFRSANPLLFKAPVVWDSTSNTWEPAGNVEGGDFSSYLEHPEFHRRVFEMREADQLRRYHQALVQKKAERGDNKNFDVHNATMDFGVEVGKACIEKCILDEFISDISSERTDPSLRPILWKIEALHALWSICNTPSFLAYQYLSLDVIEEAHSLINDLLGEIRPHVKKIVENLGVPRSALGIIAGDYVTENTWERTVARNSAFHGLPSTGFEDIN